LLELKHALQLQTAQALEPAIANARLAELDGPLLDKAVQDFNRVRAKDEATMALHTAIQTNSVEELQKCIEKAKAMNVDSNLIDIANNACFALGKAKARAEARQVATEWLRMALETNTLEALDPAINKANAAGVDAQMVDRATKACYILRADKAKLEAGEQLRIAMEMNTLEALVPAIERGKQCGVDVSKLDAAVVACDNVKAAKAKDEATRALRSAMASNSVDHIRHSIEKAKHAKVDDSLVDAADDQCAVLCQAKAARDDATEMVQAALGRNTIDALQRAIEKGRVVGVDASLLVAADRACSALKLEKAKRIALEKLQVAMEANTLEDLEPAIQQAQHAGVDAVRLKMPMLRLENMKVAKAAQEAAIEAIQVALDRHTIDALEQAIAQGRAAGVDLEMLDNAMKASSNLRAEKAKQDACDQLEMAMAVNTIDALEPAIERARRAGIDADRLEMATMARENVKAAKATLDARL